MQTEIKTELVSINTRIHWLDGRIDTLEARVSNIEVRAGNIEDEIRIIRVQGEDTNSKLDAILEYMADVPATKTA